LHAERRGLERIGAAAIVEGIEHDLDLIVVVDVFPVRHSGADLSRVVEADKDCVEILLVVSEVRFRSLGDRFAIVRIALREAGDFGHL
jgi:hypothetical protein